MAGAGISLAVHRACGFLYRNGVSVSEPIGNVYQGPGLRWYGRWLERRGIALPQLQSFSLHQLVQLRRKRQDQLWLGVSVSSE
jgi:hypothetical protein